VVAPRCWIGFSEDDALSESPQAQISGGRAAGCSQRVEDNRKVDRLVLKTVAVAPLKGAGIFLAQLRVR
jgi:hypothetical protein